MEPLLFQLCKFSPHGILTLAEDHTTIRNSVMIYILHPSCFTSSGEFYWPPQAPHCDVISTAHGDIQGHDDLIS